MPKYRVATTLVPVSLLAVLLAAGAAFWLWADPGFERAGGDRTDVANVPEDEFDRRVRDYLMRNPQVILESVTALRDREQAEQETRAITALDERAGEILRDPDSPVGGNPEGDVTLVEFFDYNCPYCRRVAPVVQEAVAADGELRVVYKEFPILGANSVTAAKAALAAHRQGKYVAFHKAMMVAKRADDDAVTDIANEIGLDLEALRRDMEDPAIAAAIERNMRLALDLRITGTPGFVVGQDIIRGATDLGTLQGSIAKARGSSDVEG